MNALTSLSNNETAKIIVQKIAEEIPQGTDALANTAIVLGAVSVIVGVTAILLAISLKEMIMSADEYDFKKYLKKKLNFVKSKFKKPESGIESKQ